MPNPNPRELIEGRPVLVVIDIQKDTFAEEDVAPGERCIPIMDGYVDRMLKAKIAIDKAHEKSIPIIFIREAHREDLIDFGRELDGDETVHCVETDPNNQLAVEEMGILPSDYRIKKRRYSAFFGTDFEILLKGLKADTLLLCGGLTDVCVHYTFVDGHQHDYFCRVIEDCVGGSSWEAHEASLKAMEYLQTGARRSLDEVIGAMDALPG
ncbi:cysteine hydrolase [Alphaproteobacteria bacterium]|jgi:biuret amidohydrolase|nr:cysteine hydrolase [Alphaproteobacteria bacterium]